MITLTIAVKIQFKGIEFNSSRSANFAKRFRCKIDRESTYETRDLARIEERPVPSSSIAFLCSHEITRALEELSIQLSLVSTGAQVNQTAHYQRDNYTMDVRHRTPEPPDRVHQFIRGGILSCTISMAALLLFLTYYILVQDEPGWPPNEFDCYPTCPRGTYFKRLHMPQCEWECEDKLSIPGIGYCYFIGGLTLIATGRWLKVHWNSR